MNGAVVVCSSTTLVNTQSATKSWSGGRASLVVNADAYGTNLHLEYQSGFGGVWVRVNTSNLTANQCMALDVPAGQVRMAVTGSTAVNLTAVLVGIPY